MFSAPETAVPVDGQPVDELDPAKPFAGHFDQSDMAPPGSISMPGYHGANVQNVQIRMMVDELLGARHHAMFIVQFRPNPDGVVAKTAKEHFHPFEEIYYLISGETQSFCDGQTDRAGVGDLIFAPVGASHGFAPISESPLCWVEVQSPLRRPATVSPSTPTGTCTRTSAEVGAALPTVQPFSDNQRIEEGPTRWTPTPAHGCAPPESRRI